MFSHTQGRVGAAGPRRGWHSFWTALATTATLTSGYALTGCGAYTNWTTQGSLLWKIKPQSPGACNVASKDHVNGEATSIYGYAIGLRGF